MIKLSLRSRRSPQNGWLEPLEARIAPANVILPAGAGPFTLELDPVDSHLHLIDGAGVELFDEGDPVGDDLVVTGGGAGDVFNIVTSTAGSAAFTGLLSVTIPGPINVQGAVTTGTDLALSSTGASISQSSAITLGASGAHYTAARKIVFNPNSSLTTDSGNIVLLAHQGAGQTASFIGIQLDNADLISTGTGTIELRGNGGNAGDNNAGIALGNGAQIASTSAAPTAGTITLLGKGGATNDGNHGVLLAGSNTLITSVAGAISITGFGDGLGTGANTGVQVASGAQVTSTGTGPAASITIDGTGSGGAGGIGNHGVLVAADGKISVQGPANLTITGTEGGGSNADGINLTGANATVESTGGGSLSLITNNLVLDPMNAVINSGTATTTVRPRTNGTPIDLGGLDVPMMGLGLSDGELDRITAGTVAIGDGNSGAITVSEAITHANSLSLTTGAGMTFNQAVTMAADRSFTASAPSASTGTIAFANGTADLAASGAGAISLTTARNISLSTGASVTTVNGNLTLSANQQMPATSGSFIGIEVSGGLVQSTGTGVVTVLGKGGDGAGGSQPGVRLAGGGSIMGGTAGTLSVQGTSAAASGGANHGLLVTGAGSAIGSSGANVAALGTATTTLGNFNAGIYLQLGGRISAGGSGSVNVQGTGAPAAGGSNSGVQLDGVGGAVSTITSLGGNVTVTGLGGSGGGDGNYGVIIGTQSLVSATGTGSVTVTGTGGATAGHGNMGVRVTDANSRISATGGDITITGTGGGVGGFAGHNNEGVAITNSALIAGATVGKVTITGAGGAGTGADNLGLEFFSNSVIRSGGDIRLTATEGGGPAPALQLFPGAGTIFTTGTGTITMVADSMAIGSGVTINAGTREVALRQFTDGVGIDLGGATNPKGGPLSLTDAELDTITGGTVRIGDSNSGAIAINTAVTHANSLALATGASVSGAFSLTLGAGKSLSLSSTGPLNLNSALIVPGTLTLAAGLPQTPADITLTNPGNAFANVVIVHGATVSLREDSGFNLGGASFATALSMQSNGTITQSAPLTGTGGVTKTGAGALLLSSANTYGGATTITAGALQLGAAEVIPDGPGTGGVSVNVGASLDLNGFNETINALSGAGAVLNSAPLPATLAVGSNNATSTLSNPITGLVSLSKVGAGTLTLSNPGNNFTGGTTINAGTLTLGAAGVLPNGGTVVVNGGHFNLNGFNETVGGFTLLGGGIVLGGGAVLTSNTNYDLRQGIVDVALAGNVGLIVSGGGLAILDVTATYTGATEVRSGTLQLNAGPDTLPAGTSLILGDAGGASGILDLNNLNQEVRLLATVGAGANNRIIDSANDAAFPVLTVNLTGAPSVFGGILGAASADGFVLNKTGPGTLVLTGNNLQTGITTISAGTIQVGNGGTGGTLGAGLVVNDSALSFNRADAFTIANDLSGSGTLTQAGPGTLTLTANNTYTGATTVTAGALLIDGTLESTASVTVSSGGTLGGSGAIAPGVPVTINGNLAPGGSPGRLDTGAITFNAASSFNAELLGAAPNHDQLGVTGSVSLGNATLNATGSAASVPGQQIVLIDNDGADPVAGIFNGLAEGAVVAVNGIPFRITYAGGSDNNDVVLSQAVTDTEVFRNAGGDLVITDVSAGGHNDALTISANAIGSQFTINDPNNVLLATGVPGAVLSADKHTLTIPFAAVTGTQIFVNGMSGDDTLTMNFAPGNLGKAVRFDGGTHAAGGDKIVFANGTFSPAVFDFAGGNAGGVTLPGNAPLTWLGVEALDLLLTSTNVTLNFSAAGAKTINVSDTGGSRTSVSSEGNASITLPNPSSTLTIRGAGGADTINVNSLDPNFPATLAIDGLGGADLVTFPAGLLVLPGLNVKTANLGPLPALSIGAGGLEITTTAGDIAVGGNINATGVVGLHSAGAITSSGGAIGPATLVADAANGITLALSGTVVSATNTGAGGITLTSVDPLNPVGIVVLEASGETIGLNGNSFSLTRSDGLANTSGLSVGGTFNLNGFDETLTALSGAGTITNTAQALSTLTIGADGGIGTFNGAIQGHLTLVKIGTGTLVLAGPATHDGGTTITTGTLQFDAHGSALNSAFNLGGGTLLYNLPLAAQVLSPTINLTQSSSIGVAAGKQLTLSEVISGPGSLTKTGAGTLVLGNDLNTFGPGAVTINGGVLQVASDGALGDLTNQIVFNNATLKTSASFASAREIVQNSGVATLDVAAGALTLIGPVGDQAALQTNQIGAGALQFAFVYLDDKPVFPGLPVFVGGTSVATVGNGTVIVHTVNGAGNQIDTIELSNTTSKTSLIIIGPGTINRIISDGDLGSIVLGTGVVLGDGVRDSVPDLEITGRVGKLELYDLNSYVFADLGADLPYDAPGTKIPDTYNHRPNLTIHDVTGPGVLFDVTGNGLNHGLGGGGLGAVVVNSWHSSGIPGAIRTTQSIGSFKLLEGDCTVVFQVDKFGVGSHTEAGLGSMVIQNGNWGSSGSEIEGMLKSFDADGFLAGATLTAGSMGLVDIGVNDFAGLITLLDADAPGIPTFTVNSDFTGSILSAAPIKKLKVRGDFIGSLEAFSIGSITAYSFLGTNIPGEYSEINATDGSVGTLTATAGVVRNFSIVTDLAFNGFNIKLSKLTGPGTVVGIDNVLIQARTIGKISVSLAAAPIGAGGLELIGIRDSTFVTTGNGTTKTTLGSIGNVTVTILGAAAGASAIGIMDSTFDALVTANEFASQPAASTVNSLGKIAVKITGHGGVSLGLENVAFAGNSIGATTVSVTPTAASAATAIRTADFKATGAIGALSITGNATSTMVEGLTVSAGTTVGAVTVKSAIFANGTLKDSAILAGQALDMTGFADPKKLASAGLGAVNVSGSIVNSKLVAGGSIGAVTVGKNLTNSLILAGAKLGGDFLLDGDETYQRTAAIAAITVMGNFATTSIAAGVNPGNGIFGDGDTAATNLAGTSSIGPIVILGSLSTGTAHLSSHQFAIEAAAIKSLKIGLAPARTNFSSLFYLDTDDSGGENASDVLVTRV